MLPARLSAASGARGARGLVAILNFQNVANVRWAEAWGTVPGPAVVRVAVVPGRNSVSALSRAMPLAAPEFSGNRQGQAADDVRSASIPLIWTDGAETAPPSLSSLWGGSARLTWYPQVRVPWAKWTPALWVLPNAAGQIWIAFYSISYGGGVS